MRRSFRVLVRRCAGVVASLVVASTAYAQDDPTPVLETTVVSGVQPGPGLWRVSKDGHEMRILATVIALPKRMSWASAGVEARIARADVVLLPPVATFDFADGRARPFFLLPPAPALRDNPDGRTLDDVLPDASRAAWHRLRQAHLGRDRGLDHRRPFFAANELYERAARRAGLTYDDLVGAVVTKAASRAGVPVVRPTLTVAIADPDAAMARFAREPLDDLACFDGMLADLEIEIDLMRRQANAWATADAEGLANLGTARQYATCNDVLYGAPVMVSLGLGDLRERLQAQWIDDAEKVLATHARSVAVMPLWHLVRPHGIVATLRARGYVVEPP